MSGAETDAAGESAPELRAELTAFGPIWRGAEGGGAVPRGAVDELAARLQRRTGEDGRRLRLMETDLRDRMPVVHAVNVAALSIVLARSLSYRRDDIRCLARAALLHDIGKTRLDDTVPDGTRGLTRNQHRALRRHPERGAELLSRTRGLELSMVVAFEHHMTRQGGYPTVRYDRRPHTASRLIQLCDVFEARRSGGLSGDGLAVDRVLDYLRSRTGSHYDPGFVGALTRSLRRAHVDLVPAPGPPCALCQVGRARGSGVHEWAASPASEDAGLSVCPRCRDLLAESDLRERNPVSALLTLVTRGDLERPTVEEFLRHRGWPDVWRHTLAQSGAEVEDDGELPGAIRRFLEASLGGDRSRDTGDPSGEEPGSGASAGDPSSAGVPGRTTRARRGRQRLGTVPPSVIRRDRDGDGKERETTPAEDRALECWRRVRARPESADYDELRSAWAEAGLHDPLEPGVVFRRAVHLAFRRDDYVLGLRACNSLLRANYLDLQAHVWASEALQHLQRKTGRASDWRLHRRLSAGLLSSVRASGDGQSPATAYQPISLLEIYAVLRAEGLASEVGPPSVFEVEGDRYHRFPVRGALGPSDGTDSPGAEESVYFRAAWRDAGDGSGATGDPEAAGTVARTHWWLIRALEAKQGREPSSAADHLERARELVREKSRNGGLPGDAGEELLETVEALEAR